MIRTRLHTVASFALPVFFLAALLLAAAWQGNLAQAEEAAKVSPEHAQRMKEGLALFKEHVRPLFVKHCLDCHGGKQTKADFDLASRDALFDSGMVEEEDAESSYLLTLLKHEEEPFMPLKAEQLPAEAIGHVARWLELGAPYDTPLVDKSAAPPKDPSAVTFEDRQFWSFQPLAVVAPPAIQNSDWVRSPIDCFIVDQLQAKGLTPNKSADRRTLIRRATFDLIGLPPTPEEIDAFVADADPLAYEKLIDRLLASEHYGERWARHWIDIARFAESHGYEQDYDRPNAHHYRDFLIRAFNQDLPYDQFVRWQVAGDELAPENPQAMMATGFLGGGAFPTQLTETEFESARYEELDDMSRTTTEAFLGLTLGCARCHDHKYDPIPSNDYYRFIASFSTTIRSEIDLEIPGKEKGKTEKVKVQVTSEGLPHMKHHADGRGFPHFYKETHYLIRGDVKQKGKVANAGFLQVLMAPGKDRAYWQVAPPEGWTRTSFRRASLANWLTDSRDGAGRLAARVIVNRLWQHHFGRGIVATPNDFGFQGERPTHPELLDWLATDLVQNGWRLKRMHRQIMTSAVYRQTTESDAARKKVDPENLLHWRRTPVRLDAEPIRDAMLAVSGLLDPTMYGPGSLDESMRRRSVYFFIKRSKLIPMMMLFDWPEHLVSIGQRSRTTIAPQALMFLNHPQARAYAEGFAKRLEGLPPEKAVPRAYRLAFGRRPTTEQTQAAGAYLARQAASYQTAKQENPAAAAMADLCQALMSSNEFVYID